MLALQTPQSKDMHLLSQQVTQDIDAQMQSEGGIASMPVLQRLQDRSAVFENARFGGASSLGPSHSLLQQSGLKRLGQHVESNQASHLFVSTASTHRPPMPAMHGTFNFTSCLYTFMLAMPRLTHHL